MPKHDVNVEQREEVDQILLVNTPSGKEENCRDEEQCLRHALRRIPNEPPTGNPPGNDATRNPQIPHDEIESVYCGEGRDDLRRLENVDIGHAAPAAVACRLRHGRESEGVPSHCGEDQCRGDGRDCNGQGEQNLASPLFGKCVEGQVDQREPLE